MVKQCFFVFSEQYTSAYSLLQMLSCYIVAFNYLGIYHEIGEENTWENEKDKVVVSSALHTVWVVSIVWNEIGME